MEEHSVLIFDWHFHFVSPKLNQWENHPKWVQPELSLGLGLDSKLWQCDQLKGNVVAVQWRGGVVGSQMG